MSKIHEALKRAAGTPVEVTADVPSHTPDPAEKIPPGGGHGAPDIHQDEVGSPALRFDMIEAPQVVAHDFLVAEHAPKSMAAEQFRTLRTRIQRISSGSPRKLLLVTSPGPGEGKTLVSVNLAMSLAQEVDSRVLLVGCDLRRPSLHKLLGLPDDRHPGLTDYLKGRVSLEKAIWRFGRTSLHVLLAGSVPDNPSELLGSPRMAETLDYLAGQFDQVVLDAPPLNPVADPAILVPQVDGVLMVVRYGQTGRAGLSRGLETIPDDKILGMVFNAADMRFSGYYYSYEYSDEQSE